MGRCEPAFMAEDSICGSRNGTVEELTYTSEDVRGVTLKSLDEYGCFQGNKNDIVDPVCSRPEGCQLFRNNEDSVARPVTEQLSCCGLTRPLCNSNGYVTSPVDGSCAFSQEIFSANLVDSSFGLVESVSVRNDLCSGDASEREPQLQEERGFPSSSNNGGTTTLVDGCPASSQTFGANLEHPSVSISTGDDTCNQQLGTNCSVLEQKQQDECGFLLSNTNWVATIPVNWCPTASQNLGAGLIDSGFGLEVSTFQRDASRNLQQHLDCTELEKNLQDQLGLEVPTSGRDLSLERQQDMGVSIPVQKLQDECESSRSCSNKSEQVKKLCWTGDLGSYLAVPDLEEGWPLTYGSTVDSIVQMYNEARDCSEPDYVGVPPEEAVTKPKEVVEQKCYSLGGTSANLSSQAMNIEEDISILMQQLLNIAPGFSGEGSTPLQSSLALDIVNDDSSRRHAKPDLQQSDAFNNAMTCSSMIDSIDGADCEGKASNKNYVSESNSPDDVRVLPRRSTRVSKLNEMNEAKKASSQLGKKVNSVSLPQRSSGFSCKIARKKRSTLCKLARSSKWGELGNMKEVFKQNDGILKRDSDIIQAQTLGSWKTSGCEGSKKKKSQTAENSQEPEGKPNASIRRVNLKIKIGKLGDRSYLKVVSSEGAGSLPRVETMINERLSESNQGTGIEVPQEASGVGMKHKFGEDVQPPSGSLEKPGTPFDVPVLDVHTAGKDLASIVTQAKPVGHSSGDCHGVSSQTGSESLGKASLNKGLSSDRSPDPEAISVVQDVQVAGKQMDLQDAGFDSPEAVVHPQNVMDANMLLLYTKKGKRSGKVKGSRNPVGGCCVMGERASGPTSLHKTRKLSKRRPQQKVEDGLDILNSTGQIGASNNSSNEGSFRESVPLSGLVELGACHEYLEIENGSQACELPNHDVRIKETGTSELSASRTNYDLEKSSRDATAKVEEFTNFDVGQEENHPDLGGSINVPFVMQKDSVTSGPTELNELSTVANETSYNLVRNGAGKNLQPENISSSNSAFSGSEEQALPPQVAWVCCDDCHKWRCISAALADYLEVTHCKWICKDNEDKAFADCSIPQEKSNADINAALGISDASCEEEAYDRCPNYNAFECKQTAVPEEATWKLIKSNLFLHRSRKTQTIDETMVCHCTPPPDGSSGCGDECLNRILNIECVKGTCPCGNLCSNQQFQKGQYSKLKCVRCGKKGYGLQLQEDVSEGQFLIEYVGEVLDLHAYEARQKSYASRGQKHFYFMALNGSEVIDACSKGNLGRFINHSCEPNCRTEKWMVNGEICIGLFAMRDIKKGEELTFDYNYVRVYGAAAKKCFCGSSLCRGYIGGDPLNAETVVQGDSDEEFPVPVMIDEDNIDEINSVTSFDGATQFASVPFQARDSKSELAIMGFDTSLEKGYALAPSLPSDHPLSSPELSLKMDGGLSKSPFSVPLEVSVQSNAQMRKPPPSAQLVKVSLNKEDTSNKSSCKVQDTSSLTANTIKKCMINPVGINKSRLDTVEDKPNISKSRLRVKASRSASSTKKGKSTAYPVIANKTQVMTKPNKQMDGSIRSRFEGVEEKLNELLDKERGISKRKDASRRYLKLLVLTAASGDGGNGEAFQSARDLSIILDALMKTKSRTVLTDIINKNGLQMLHNILKQNRRDFNRIPILRKLLKVLEFLALKGILKLEHINGGPPHPGMESFTDSILALTRHSDLQVHQIARSFRDRWIPRYSRRFSHFDRDDSKLEPCSGPNSNWFVSSQKGWHDQGLRPPEIINCISPATVAPTSVKSNTQEGSSAPPVGSSLGSGTRTRKRKSRWDQPAEMKNTPPPPPNEGKIEPCPRKLEISEAVQDQPFDVNRGKNASDVSAQSLPQKDDATAMVDGMQNIPDGPPGFSFPSCSNGPAGPPSDGTVETGSLFPQIACPVSCGFEVKVAHPQERYLPFLHVSYGIPLPLVQQLGTLQTGTTDCWSIAPGVAFHPFPPLPPYSCEKNNPLSSSSLYPMVVDGHGGVQQLGHCGAGHNMDQCIPSTSGARPDGSVTRENNQDDQVNGSSYGFERMYVRQQNWNENADPRFPWRRNDLGVNGNSSKNRVYSVGVGHIGNAIWSHCSQGVNNGSENVSSSFHQHTQQQYQH